MATQSSILAWKIPRVEEPGRLQSRSHKESDTTEQLHFHFHIHIYVTSSRMYVSVSVCMSVFFRIYILREREQEQEKFISRNWLAQLQGLASPKSKRQASRLETQGRVDTVVSSPKTVGMQNYFVFRRLQSLSLSTDRSTTTPPPIFGCFT